MATPSTLNRILVMLCLLAIPCAQLFGVRKVFHCDCSGSMVTMMQDRCFGINGEDCHAWDHEEHAEHGDEDSHSHAETRDSFRTGEFSLKPLALPAPILLDALRFEIPPHRVADPEKLSVRLEFTGDPPSGQWPGRHCILLI